MSCRCNCFLELTLVNGTEALGYWGTEYGMGSLWTGLCMGKANAMPILPEHLEAALSRA